MVLKKKIKFTPELLISAPRWSPATPNPDGTHAVFTVSTYSIDSNVETKEVKIVDIANPNFKDVLCTDIASGFVDPQWLVGTRLLWKTVGEGQRSDLWTLDVADKTDRPHLVGTIDAPISEIKTKELPNGTIALTFAAPADAYGSLLNPERLPKPSSSAREYESSRVRFWDKYWEPYRSTLWYTTLVKDPGSTSYKLYDGPLNNAFKDTAIEFPWAEHGLGAGGSYDISKTGLLVTVNDPKYDPAERLTSEVYYVGLTTFNEYEPRVLPLTRMLKEWSGSAGPGVFSADGKKIALLKRKNWKRDWENPSIFVLRLVSKGSRQNIPSFAIQQVSIIDSITGKDWDRSPTSLVWSQDGNELYAIAEEWGQNRLFRVSTVQPDHAGTLSSVAHPVDINGSITSLHRLGTRGAMGGAASFFVNSTSFIDSCTYHKVVPRYNLDYTLISAVDNGADFGLHSTQVGDFEYPGAGDYYCHSFIIVPSYFRHGKRYPVALWPHGGPQMAWTDSWSTRWNPAVMAEQGYIVIMPNVTGSTGYGQQFCEDVLGDWGGRPYQDLEKCWEYVEKHFDYVDPSKAVCLGGSYGGYMVKWIAGQPLAKKFLALVCHDGIWGNLNLMAGDVAYAVPDDMGGPIFDPSALQNWDKYSPARLTANWTQPMLIIHSDNDYRCPITEGLAAFNVCQQKGIESRFLNFPDENHFVLSRGNSLHWYRTVLGWCNKFAGIKDGVQLQPPVNEPWTKAEVQAKVKRMENNVNYLTM